MEGSHRGKVPPNSINTSVPCGKVKWHIASETRNQIKNKKKRKNNENIQATSKKVNGKVFVMNAGETTPHFTLRTSTNHFIKY